MTVHLPFDSVLLDIDGTLIDSNARTDHVLDARPA